MRPRRFLTVVVSAAIAVAAISGAAMAAGGRAHRASSASTSLPVKAMERALHAKGSVVDGNLNVGLDRTDITNVHIGKVPIKPAFEINGGSTSSRTENTALS
jgi:hypothetical protein